MRALAVCSLLLTLLAATCAPAARAQGCVMCRSTAAAANEAGQKALDLAILVLLIPTVSIFLAVFYWAFRRRNRTWAEPEPDAPPPPEPLPHELNDAALWRAYRQ
jgi:cbb3-type cytochrome oxidase subunit 3